MKKAVIEKKGLIVIFALLLVLPGLLVACMEDDDDDGGGGGKPIVEQPIEIDNAVVIVDSLEIAGGFDLDDDGVVDNAAAEMTAEATIVNAALTAFLDGSEGILLIDLDGLDELPLKGESATVDLYGYLGVDMGGGAYDIDDASFDADGNAYIAFKGVTVATDEDGNVSISYSTDSYVFTFYSEYFEGEVDAELKYMKFSATLTEDPAKAGYVKVTSAQGGAAIPCTFIDQLDQMAMDLYELDVSHVCDNADIDFDGDEVPDGLSIGLTLTGSWAEIVAE